MAQAKSDAGFSPMIVGKMGWDSTSSSLSPSSKASEASLAAQSQNNMKLNTHGNLEQTLLES